MYKFLIWFLFATTPVMASQNVVIVYDDSASMGTGMQSNSNISRNDCAKKALIAVLSKLPADTKVGIVLLNGNWTPDKWLVPLNTIDKNSIVKKVDQISPTGGTPLGGCMKAGADSLLALRQKDHYGSYRLLVVTDGEASDPGLVESYLPDILSRGLTVDAIGVDMSSTHSLATKVHHYNRGDDPDQMTKAVAATFAETAGNDSSNDFAIIEPIPDEMAPLLLAALSEGGGNWPIGESAPKPVVDAQGKVQTDADGNVILQPVEDDKSHLAGVIVVALLIGLVLVFIIGMCST